MTDAIEMFLLRGFANVRAEWAHRLRRPQSSEAGSCEACPEVEFVRRVAATPCSTLTDGQRA